MDKLQIYLYFIIGFASISFIMGIILYICKKPVWLKLQSIYARRQGLLKVNHIDGKKNKTETFSKEFDMTIRFKRADGTPMLQGISREHIYYDSIYDIMSIDTNIIGSYTSTSEGDMDQSFLSPTLADALFKKISMSPSSQDAMHKLLKILLIICIAIAAVLLINTFMGYEVWSVVKDKLANWVAPKVL